MHHEPKPAAILYAAKSTEDKRGSISTQLEDCRALVEREGLVEVAYYDEEQASAWSGDRGPKLAAALDHAERLGASLIVQHSDRAREGRRTPSTTPDRDLPMVDQVRGEAALGSGRQHLREFDHGRRHGRAEHRGLAA